MAVTLKAELAFLLKRALRDKAGEIVYLTVYLMMVPKHIFKMFVYKHVVSNRQLILWTTDSEEVPLFHI